MKKKIIILLMTLSIASCNFSKNKEEIIYKEKTDIYEINWIAPETPYSQINKEIIEMMKEDEIDIKYISKKFNEDLVKSDEISALLPYKLEGQYEIIKNNLNIYSFIYKTYMYIGGAHGMEVFTIYNIDKNTGKKVQLKKLLGENYQEKVIDRINKDIAKNNMLKNNNSNKIFYSVDKITSLEGSKIYFEGDNLVILFPEYVISSYSNGKITFKILINEPKN